MRILLFYTFHRHFAEISYASMFFNKSKFLKDNCDVYLHCNNPQYSVENLQRVSTFEANTSICVTAKNAGYNWGIPESHADCFEMSSKYDYVLYCQPDNYIVDDTKLAKEFDSDFEALVSPLHHIGRACCSGDFFAVKPTKNIFSNWQEKTHIYNVNEHYVMDTIYENYINIRNFHRDNVKQRSRLIDDYGMWHEHDNNKVERFLGIK